jgi:2-polyprenyl-3-methyl-5-hydroxy-6-metoxy-1,4-benzoquinol methylase
MIDSYASIAEEYKKAKHHPWRIYIEDFTLFELIGDLRGKTVLDLACGEGFYTRKIKQRGAARVVGVDVSQPMIDLARAEETKSSLGIEYVIQDATQLNLPICFDLVVAAYLLNHARAGEELLAMCYAVSGSLKPGCRFVAVNNNAEQPVELFPSMKKYGFIKNVAGKFQQGTPIMVTLSEHPDV